MANTYIAIATVEVGAGGAATIDFTSIPNTYTDLLVKLSGRNATTSVATGAVYFNSDTTDANYSYLRLLGDGSSTSSLSDNYPYWFYIPTTGNTANTFGNTEIYIPNYAGSAKKSISSDTLTENNASSALAILIGGLWDNTSAITSIKLDVVSGDFAQYSTATLYGIKNS